MIYWQLFWGFLQVGCFAFGAYAAIPFIRDIVLRYGWLDEAAISQIIAISESTPGPIMINMATYVGQTQGGFWGALVATTAVVIPSFFVTIAIMAVLHNILNNRWVRTCLNGLTPCIAGIISITGLALVAKSLQFDEPSATWSTRLLIAIILVSLEGIYYKAKKTMLSPIILIVIAALFGILIESMS